jgi:hypothetical protein
MPLPIRSRMIFGDVFDDTTVIMYRGSDSFTVPGAGGSGPDVFNGYGIALGSPYGPQARLAVEFYNTVVSSVSRSTGGDSGPFIVSGHSLGGGGLAANDNNRMRIAA